MPLKQRVFPANPFLHTYATIMIADGLIMLASIALSVRLENWLYAAAGTIVAIVIFVVLNKRCLKALSCPKCNHHMDFEAGEGFVCKPCATVWSLN